MEFDLPQLSDYDKHILASLKKLDGSSKVLNDWEANFMESCLQRLNNNQPLTDKQNIHANNLLAKYGY